MTPKMTDGDTRDSSTEHAPTRPEEERDISEQTENEYGSREGETPVAGSVRSGKKPNTG